jgi:hypothetical protein
MREKIVFLGIIGLIVGLTVDLGLMIDLSWDNTREAYAQQGCEKVQTFTGNGIKDTQPFTVTSDTWRLRYKFQSTTGNQQNSTINITVYKSGGDIPESVVTLADRTGNDTTYVDAGAGTYYLSIGPANTTWTVTVEDCGAPASPGTPNPGSVSASASAPTSAPTSASASTSAYTSASASASTPVEAPPSPKPKPDPNLFNSGGPTTGPLPLMPDGGCPQEFPVQRGQACYPR